VDISNVSPTALDRTALAAQSRITLWIPVGLAILYPWALKAFHAAITAGSTAGTIEAGLWLVAAFALPLAGLALSLRAEAPTAARRLGFAALAAPPLFVLTGVVAGLLHSPVRDIWIWPVAWILAGVAASLARPDAAPAPARPVRRLRVVHGVAGALILLFVAFHLSNHLMGLFGPEAHGRVMKAGRVVYRSALVEPLLVGLLLFQVACGLRLAWRWSARPADLARTVQVGSGAYLAAFILTHLNSALVSARAVHGVQTDWAWASGAPDGLLLDAWNIRLVPHYALGVFFVVAHLFCGLRGVLLAHGTPPAVAQRVWWSGLTLATTLSATIIAALCGLRLA
jgi:succinate dehydrogenase/fumarate reductase cytochrome b subunit